MDPRHALHAMAFGALVAAATIGIGLAVTLARPPALLSVAENRTPTPTITATVSPTETPRPTQTATRAATQAATGTATPDVAATVRAIPTATATKAPPTATPAPTDTPRPTNTPKPPPTNTPTPTSSPSPSPPKSPTASPTARPSAQARLTPEQTVARYYELLNRRQFKANYDMLSAAGKRHAGSLAEWEEAVSPIVGATIRDVSTVSQSSQEATVTGLIELTRSVDGQVSRSRYQASVFLVSEDGMWKIDRILRSNETPAW